MAKTCKNSSQNPNAIWEKLVIDHARLQNNIITYDEVNDILINEDLDAAELMDDILEAVQLEGIQVVDEIPGPVDVIHPFLTIDADICNDAVRTLIYQTLQAKNDIENRYNSYFCGLVEEFTDQELLAQIATMDIGSSVRIAAVSKLFDQTLLFQIATKDIDSSVCYAAVDKLTNKTFLAQIATGDTNSYVRHAAVNKLTNKTLLKQIATKDIDSAVRCAAVKRLTNQTLLSKIAIEDDDNETRKVALENLTDQVMLAKIAIENEDSIVRKVAVLKLTDQASLAQVAVEDEDEYVRCAAVKNLTDQTLLAQIATKNKYNFVRFAAVENLTNQELLSKIAIKDENEYVRIAAISKLTDQDLLSRIVLTDENSDIRNSALEQLIDQTLLAKVAIAICDEDYFLREAVLEKLTDKSLITKVILEDENIVNRKLEVTKLTNQVMLAKIAVEDKEWFIRQIAVKKLTDQSLISKVAINDKMWFVRQVAVKMLKNQSELSKVVLNSKDDNVSYAAVSKLTDQNLLAKIAVKCKYEICMEAVCKLTDQKELMRVLYRSDDEDIRKIAIDNLTDQTLLAKIAIEYPIISIRKAAMKKITDQMILSKVVIDSKSEYNVFAELEQLTDELLLSYIAINAKDLYYREAAIHKITNRELLTKIAIENKERDTRIVEILKLTDQTVLAKIAVENKEYDIRKAAIIKLTDQVLLSNIAINDKDWNIRCVAVSMLTDQKLIARIAQKDNESYVRCEAIGKITEWDLLDKILESDPDEYLCEVASERCWELHNLADEEDYEHEHYEDKEYDEHEELKHEEYECDEIEYLISQGYIDENGKINILQEDSNDSHCTIDSLDIDELSTDQIILELNADTIKTMQVNHPLILPVPKTMINPIDGAEMVWVPEGTFTMGSINGVGVDDEHPNHQVTLSGFWMYKYEVTVAQYIKFCTATSRVLPDFPTDYSWGCKSDWHDSTLQNHPIVGITWHDSKSYADWAGVNLPTEAQWEYAARGPQGNNYPWGGIASKNDLYNAWDNSMCANVENSFNYKISTWPVDSFPDGKSWCGIHDLAGNVIEWCADWYGIDYYKNAPANNPTGPATGYKRVLRSGSWFNGIYFDYGGGNLCASRDKGNPDDYSDIIGFRCVMSSISSEKQNTSIDIRNETLIQLGITLISIPEGDFFYGENKERKYLPKFDIMKYPVTVSQYQFFCEVTNRKMPEQPKWGWHDAHPVVNVSWHDATAFAEWVGLALPTEEEWEKAACGIDGRIFPWGNVWDEFKCCNKISQTLKQTIDVGSFPTGVSPYGIHDMSGNVCEWCDSWYDQLRTTRVLRGGSWYNNTPDYFRTTYRRYDIPAYWGKVYGFRCILRSS